MKFPEINSYRKDSNLLKWILGVVLLMSVSFNFYSEHQRLEFQKNFPRKVIVYDCNHQAYVATFKELSPVEREAQYKRHTENFFELFFEVESGTFQERINAALELAGPSGERYYNRYYQEKQIEQRIMEDNYKLFLTVTKNELDLSKSPITGNIECEWTFTRPSGSTIVRNLKAYYTVDDVGVTYKNPFGVKVNIDIYDDSRISSGASEDFQN